MKLFRNGRRYLVFFSIDRGYVYDAETGEASKDARPADLLGASAREWLPVHDHEDLPAGLVRRLILPMGRDACA